MKSVIMHREIHYFENSQITLSQNQGIGIGIKIFYHLPGNKGHLEVKTQ